MPDYTGNLNLAKPIPNEDSADIRVINENMDKIDEWSTEINKKTKGATSEVAGIVKYGTDVSTALEGHRMAQIQGVEKCGGDVQTPGVKKVGYSYWCTANKDFYVCKVENSLNYIDDAYFDAFSNAALLGKLQNFPITPTNLWRGNVANTTIEIPALKKYSVIFCNIKLHGLTSYVFVKNVTGGGHDDLGDAKNASFTLNFNDSSLTIKTVTSAFVTPTLTEVWGVM